MIDINQLTTFFGWCTAINIAFYGFSALAIIVFKDLTTALHSKIIGLPTKALPALYFKFLGTYKICIITFNLVPYIALNLMS